MKLSLEKCITKKLNSWRLMLWWCCWVWRTLLVSSMTLTHPESHSWTNSPTPKRTIQHNRLLNTVFMRMLTSFFFHSWFFAEENAERTILDHTSREDLNFKDLQKVENTFSGCLHEHLWIKDVKNSQKWWMKTITDGTLNLTVKSVRRACSALYSFSYYLKPLKTVYLNIIYIIL